MDHVRTLEESICGTNQYDIPRVFSFVGYEPAFDSVISSKLEALGKQGMDAEYNKLLQSIYKDATA